MTRRAYNATIDAFRDAQERVHAPVIAPAEDLQADDYDRPRLHPLVTSLWVAAGLLVAAHIIWVARGMPVPAFLSPVLEMLNV